MAQAEHQGLTDDLELGPVGVWAEESGLRDSKFFAEYLNRLVTGRDMHVIITAASETGVGKTTLAASLAIILDQHGWNYEKACVADAKAYSVMYDDVPEGSVLILDEAEKAADARRGMSTESVELSQAFAAKRYQQVFGMLTAPSKSWVDKRLGGDAADYWIQAQQTDLGRIKGEAKVYRLRENEHYEQDYTERTETIHWPVLDWHLEFKKLDKRKQEILESDEGAVYVHRDELEAEKERARKAARKELENEVIQRMTDEGYSQKEIGAALDYNQATISRRLNDDA